MIYKNLILDVDGVLTDGKFHYNENGKQFKIFGSDDADSLQLMRSRFNIVFVSGDKRGFQISKKRVGDMGFELNLVSTYKRLSWISERFNPLETIYIGDGIYDSLVFEGVGYSIAPANAFIKTKEAACYVLKNKGGEGAVAEAIVFILEHILQEEFDIEKLLKEKDEKRNV